MDTIPTRLKVAQIYRKPLELLEKKLLLPNINPGIYQLFALIASLSTLFASTNIKIVLLFLILFSDWLDGATARRYNGKQTKTGYITDTTIDRFSEGFIFIGETIHLIGSFFYILWLINIALNFYSSKTKNHLSLPLRFTYLVYLLLIQ